MKAVFPGITSQSITAANALPTAAAMVTNLTDPASN